MSINVFRKSFFSEPRKINEFKIREDAFFSSKTYFTGIIKNNYSLQNHISIFVVFMVKTKPAEKLPEFLYYMSQEEAIYNLLKDYIPIQSQAIESSIQSIETKTGFIMASIGVFVPIIVTNILTAQPKTKWILITGTCFALITLLFNIFCMWGRYFRISPNIRNFYDSFKNRNQPDTAREELLALAYNDFEYNRDILRQKATSFNISLVTFGISILFIIIGVFV